MRCVAGKYKATLGSDSCNDCPRNSTSRAGSISAHECECDAGHRLQLCPADAQCNAGHTGSEGICAPCPAGTYKPLSGPGGLRVSGQKRRCNSDLDGTYIRFSEHAGKPAYRRQGKQAKIYWQPAYGRWVIYKTLGSRVRWALSTSSDLFGPWNQACDGELLHTNLRIYNEGCLPCPSNSNSTLGSTAATDCKCHPVRYQHARPYHDFLTCWADICRRLFCNLHARLAGL